MKLEINIPDFLIPDVGAWVAGWQALPVWQQVSIGIGLCYLVILFPVSYRMAYIKAHPLADPKPFLNVFKAESRIDDEYITLIWIFVLSPMTVLLFILMSVLGLICLFLKRVGQGLHWLLLLPGRILLFWTLPVMFIVFLALTLTLLLTLVLIPFA